MKTMKYPVFAAALLALVPLAAHGGERSNGTVRIEPEWAVGTLGSARNSADDQQKIGCQLWAYVGGDTTVQCWARTSKGVSAACIITNAPASLREAVSSLDGDSTLFFDWDASGRCLSVAVADSSNYEPKAP